MSDISITELLEIDPSRVDAVLSPANGTEWLMLKAIGDGETEAIEATLDDVLAELDKAEEATRPPCSLCKGSGKIKDGNMTCPKCKGSGLKPVVGDTTKTLAEAAKEAGVAASGQHVPTRKDCPTCNGSGTLLDAANHEKQCPDCGGTGDDSTMPTDAKLNTQAPDNGKVTVGDSANREAVDKALAEYDELVKAKYNTADRKKLASSGAAMSDGSYPIADGEDLDNAIHAVGRGNADHDSIRQHIIARAKSLGQSSKIPDNWGSDGSLSDGAEKAHGDNAGGMVFTADNPLLQPDPNDVDDADGDPTDPGSPAWESLDAQALIAAGQQLAQVAQMLQASRDRENMEVAAGQIDDMNDVMDLNQALACLDQCLGLVAAMAFREEAEANKSLDGVAEKSGKRLSRKTVGQVAAVRDHLSDLLGDDDPAKQKMKTDGKDALQTFIDNANKSQKEIEEMTAEELIQLLDARDAQKAAKGMPEENDMDSVASAKNANNKAKAKKPKADMTDLEDEADQGDNDSASSPAMGAAKAELTSEQIEAAEKFEAAKALMKEAKKVQKQAAKDAAIAKEIREGIEEATKALETLQDRLGAVDEMRNRLAVVEKMAAPDAIVKAAVTSETVVKRQGREDIELEVARLEGLARKSTSRDMQKAYEDRARDEREKLVAFGS